MAHNPITRRSTLGALAAVAASVPTSVTAAAAALPSNPDAELIALGKEHARIVALYHDAVRRFEPVWEAQKKTCMEMSAAGASQQEMLAVMIRMDRDCARPHPDDCMDMIAPVEEAIMKTPARTIDGLKAKVQMAHYWNAPRPNDGEPWDRLAIQHALDAVLAFGGQS